MRSSRIGHTKMSLCPSDQVTVCKIVQAGLIPAKDSITIYNKMKNITNISAQIIDLYDEVVILECLIEKDVYEEREFNKSLFEGMELKIGNLFKLCYFEGNNKIILEIKNDPNFTLKDDFPKINFNEMFNLKMFKKKS